MERSLSLEEKRELEVLRKMVKHFARYFGPEYSIAYYFGESSSEAENAQRKNQRKKMAEFFGIPVEELQAALEPVCDEIRKEKEAEWRVKEEKKKALGDSAWATGCIAAAKEKERERMERLEKISLIQFVEHRFS